MLLSDAAIRNVRPSTKPLKLRDGEGLYLLVSLKGGRWWRFRYRIHGREKMLSMGVYPEVSLQMARQRRNEARRLAAC